MPQLDIASPGDPHTLNLFPHPLFQEAGIIDLNDEQF
jgi:hypothetical protein